MSWGHKKGVKLSAKTRAKISATDKAKHRHLSAATKAKISAKEKGRKHKPLTPAQHSARSQAMKAAAAKRKAQGIRIHRKPETAQQKAHRSVAMRTAAAKRKAAGIKIHHKAMTATQRAKLSAASKARNAAMTPAQKEARHEKLVAAAKNRKPRKASATKRVTRSKALGSHHISVRHTGSGHSANTRQTKPGREKRASHTRITHPTASPVHPHTAHEGKKGHTTSNHGNQSRAVRTTVRHTRTHSSASRGRR